MDVVKSNQQEVLQMEVEYVVKEVTRVLLDFVQHILERSEVLVKSMKCQGSQLFPKMGFFYKSSYFIYFKYAKLSFFFIKRGSFL